MTKQFDTIDVELIPEKDYKNKHFYSGSRAKIIINGKDFLDIVTEAEKRIFNSEEYKKSHDIINSAGYYNYLTTSELFWWLQTSAQSNGEDRADLFSCKGCDEAGCHTVMVDIIYTQDSVIWKNFMHISEDYKFDFRYEFERSQYDEFMNRLKIAAYNYEKKRMDSRSIYFDIERVGNVEDYLFSNTSIKLVNLSVNDIRQFLQNAKSLTIQINFAQEATKEAVEKSGVLSEELKKSDRCIVIITSNKKATLSDLNIILNTISSFHECDYMLSTIYDEERDNFRIDTFLAEL